MDENNNCTDNSSFFTLYDNVNVSGADDDAKHQFLYGSQTLEDFASFYGTVHKPLVLTVAIFGVVANCVNIFVLTRRDMISPTNVLLTGLSSAQLLLLLSYLSLTLYNYLREGCYFLGLLSYEWALFKIINVTVNVSFHSIALFHTLFLAIFRFVAVKLPHIGRNLIKVPTAKRVVLALWLIIPVLCVPVFFTSFISIRYQDCCLLSECYDLNYTQNEQILQLSLWSYGVVFKLIPSVTIGILSAYLITSLRSIDVKSERLTGKDNAKRRLQRQRLTKMLVAVALLCFTVELPHGVLNLATAIFGTRFGVEVYDYLGDFFEMLTLLYSSVNFILYSLMSKEFKRTIKKLAKQLLCHCRFCRGKFGVGVFGVDVASSTNTEFREVAYSEVATKVQ